MEFDKSDWAILISLLSVMIAGASFVWSVWSKFIFPRARVRTSIGVMRPVGSKGMEGPAAIVISATNLGPGDVELRNVVARKNDIDGLLGRETGVLCPLEAFPQTGEEVSRNPFGGDLPKRLSAGKSHSAYFQASLEFFDEGYRRFGVYDTFGRHHWCRSRDVKDTRRSLNKVVERGSKAD